MVAHDSPVLASRIELTRDLLDDDSALERFARGTIGNCGRIACQIDDGLLEDEAGALVLGERIAKLPTLIVRVAVKVDATLEGRLNIGNPVELIAKRIPPQGDLGRHPGLDRV